MKKLNIYAITMSSVVMFAACNQSTEPSGDESSSNFSEDVLSSEVESNLSQFSSSLIVLSSNVQASSQNGSSAELSSGMSVTASSSSSTGSSDWAYDSHDKGASANYSLLFPQDKIQKMEVIVSAENWKLMTDEMTAEFGSRRMMSELFANKPMAVQAGLGDDGTPMYVESTVKFGGRSWNHVGLRFKGHSTLSGSWSWGTNKMSYRLNFDKFEDEYPQINNQRFWGVKKLSLNNNLGDYSVMREMIASKAFTDFGVPTSHRAFYEVVLDYGEGPKSLGTYTVVEIPGSELMKDKFGNGGGNLYKPEPAQGGLDVRGPAMFLNEGEPNSETFEKKSNELSSDWSDVISTIEALNRTPNNSVAWRSDLEAYFNVDGFLKWLAANTVLSCGDSYGGAPHNYYLYGDESKNGLLNWIPYDLDWCLGGQNVSPMSLDNISSDWPLIRVLLDDDVYNTVYWNHLKAFNDQFSTSSMINTMDTWRSFIGPVTHAEVWDQTIFYSENQDEFDTEYEKVKQVLRDQKASLESALQAKGL